MVKKLLLMVAIMMSPLYIQAQAPLKLGKVDKLAIFNAMPEKAQAEAVINQLSEQYKAELKLLQDEFNRKYADFQALNLDNRAAGTIKERRMQELQENNDKIEVFLKNTAQDIRNKEKELLDPLMQKIDDAIKAIGDEAGYLIIYDVNNPGVAYLSSHFEDVTNLVKLHLGLNIAAPQQ
jgi:outer membrane protein